MMKQVSKRFLSLTLVLLMTLMLLPTDILAVTVFAATSGTVTGLSDPDIGLSFTGKAEDPWEASCTTITGSTTSTAGTCSNTNYETMLTITNRKATAATLFFDYAIAQSGGTIQVSGSAVSANSAYSGELASGESIKIYLKSGSPNTATAITLTNIALVANVDATATFLPAENGSYTVNGTAVTEEISYTQNSLTAYRVVATPASGYQFKGWYNVTTQKYISTDASTNLRIDGDCSITAQFSTAGVALFEAGGQSFEKLDEAVSYAQDNNQAKIILASNGEIHGDYTIPAGITLLIPFNTDGTLYTTAPSSIYTTKTGSNGNDYRDDPISTTRSCFRQLTLAGDSSLTVYGAISVGGRYAAAAGSASGYMTGDYGQIQLSDGSLITIKSGGALYAWGFISGQGSVTVESGGSVHEWFQIADFRGGSASSGMASGPVFPFSQFYVQNIETPLTLHSGAKETVSSGVYVSNKVFATAIAFVGDDGMFKIKTGSLTKDYDEETDRLVFTINGDAELNALSLNLGGTNINSGNFDLPLNNNISINIESGKVTINQTTALLAGVQATIAEGSELVVSGGKSIYIYDRDEWIANAYTCKGNFCAVGYAPGKNYNRSEKDLIDAKLDVNGTLTAIGNIYTTAGGADICSSNGTGVFIQQGAPGTDETTKQVTQSGTNTTEHEIPITAAKLHNADGSYTETTASKAGDAYVYVNGSWKSSNGWVTDAIGKQYYKDGEAQKTGWSEIDGKTYYLDIETGYAAVGIVSLIPNGATEAARCVFDTDGVFQSSVTGVYSVGENTYWLNSGIIEEEAGLKRIVKKDGEVNYYYFAVQKNLEEREGLTLSAAVKSTVLNGQDCWLHKTTGLSLPEWGYCFDENGVILHDEDTGKNGILKDGEDLFYYVDGIKAPAGMIKIGDDYYYANSKGKVIANQNYYCSRMNGLMEEGTYAFDAEGKLIQGATDKNGIVKDDDSVLRYYVNGRITYVGLIEIDGDFYYVRSNGEVVTDCVYWITWTHGLKEGGYYTFDENGKLTGAPKNGIVEEDGVLHYYVNGKLTYAGLIKIGDDYYYVNSKCEVVRDCDYYISWTHDLLPQGKYYFDADGKLAGSVAPLKNGIYEEDGSLYFYRNGERAYAGLIQIDGDYYYVRSTCEVVHDRSYYVYWTHGLMPEGYYDFDSAGRMIPDSETE